MYAFGASDTTARPAASPPRSARLHSHSRTPERMHINFIDEQRVHWWIDL